MTREQCERRYRSFIEHHKELTPKEKDMLQLFWELYSHIKKHASHLATKIKKLEEYGGY